MKTNPTKLEQNFNDAIAYMEFDGENEDNWMVVATMLIQDMRIFEEREAGESK